MCVEIKIYIYYTNLWTEGWWLKCINQDKHAVHYILHVVLFMGLWKATFLHKIGSFDRELKLQRFSSPNTSINICKNFKVSKHLLNINYLQRRRSGSTIPKRAPLWWTSSETKWEAQPPKSTEQTNPHHHTRADTQQAQRVSPDKKSCTLHEYITGGKTPRALWQVTPPAGVLPHAGISQDAWAEIFSNQWVCPPPKKDTVMIVILN